MKRRLWVPALALLALPLLASRPPAPVRQEPTPTTGFIIILPSPTPPIIIIQPSRTPTSPSSSVQTRTPTPTSTPTLPAFTLPSPTATPLDFGAELPPTITPHGDPYVPDFDLTLPSPTATPGSLTGPDTPQRDLSVTDIEVTQGLQSLDNEMPLVELRMTYARVYVRSFGGDWFPVHGVLEGWRDGEYLGMRAPENGPIPAFLGGGDRTNVDHTLNFRLPNDWRYGTVTLRAFIYSQDPESPFEEEPIWVNNFREVEVEYHLADGVSLSLWPIHLHQDYDGTKPEVLFTEDDPDTSVILAGLKRLLPTWGVFVHAPPIERLYCAGWSGGEVGVGLEGGPDIHGPCEFNLLSPGGAQEVNAVMSLIDFLTDGPWDDVFNYGMVHPFFDGDMQFYNDQGDVINYSGLALYQQTHGLMDVSTSATSPWDMEGGKTLAHEIGHRLGLGHVECVGTEELGGGLDEDFPWTLADCRIAQLNPSGFYGFDVLYSQFPGLSGPTVISNDPSAPEPNQGWPLMSYANPKWLDAYYWCASLEALGVECDRQVVPFLAHRPGAGLMAMSAANEPGPAGGPAELPRLPDSALLQADPDYLVVMGRIDRTTGEAETVHIMKIAGQKSAEWDALLSGDGLFRTSTPYSLALVNARGETLGSTPIYDGSDAHDRMGILVFVNALAFDPSASALQVREGDRVLLERIASPNAPEVRLLSPNGGETLAAPLDITWEASDADGDPLTFHLQYSPDGGETWQAVALGHRSTVLRLESLETLSGSTRGKFRVLASDGLLTGQDESDGVFRVPNSSPLAAVTSPTHRRVFASGATVVLSGSATDREDGILPERSLLWESDRDGPLGTGAEVATQTLSPGPHIITLTATDSQGASDQAWVAIAVDPAVVVTHMSEEDLQGVSGELASRGASGPGIPEVQEPTTARSGVAVVIGAGLALLGLAGLGMLIYGLRRRPSR